MTTANRKYLIDAAERVFWTAVQAALGYVSIDALGLPKGYVPLAAAVFAMVKTAAAKHVGAGNTAALLPAGPDTERGAVDVALLVLIFIAACVAVITWHYLGVHTH